MAKAALRGAGNLEYLFEPFRTAEEAARVYDREMLILKGAKARLNYAESYHGVRPRT